MLRLDISHLSEGTHTFVLDPQPEALDLDPDLFSNIQVDAQLDFFNQRLLVTLQVKADAVLECDRTLVLFEQPVSGTHRLLFAPPELVTEEQAEQYDDVRVLMPSDQQIDLTEVVHDTLVLAIPTRKIAPGAEGIEIPTRFGAPAGDEAVDPRWEALRKLRSEDNPG